jgi:hypothetical protein
MKTVAFTAVMALLVAIPLIIRKKRPLFVPVKIDDAVPVDEVRRYAIDDFLT